jgi:hypothetical protein
MKCDSLKRFWVGLFSRKQRQGGSGHSQVKALKVSPLTVGLRVDVTVPYGVGEALTASKVIWVSPAGSHSRSVKALKVLLIPN